MVNDIIKSLQGDIDKAHRGVQARARQGAHRPRQPGDPRRRARRLLRHADAAEPGRVAATSPTRASSRSSRGRRTLIPEIEKAIRAAQLGLNPAVRRRAGAPADAGAHRRSAARSWSRWSRRWARRRKVACAARAATPTRCSRKRSRTGDHRGRRAQGPQEGAGRRPTRRSPRSTRSSARKKPRSSRSDGPCHSFREAHATPDKKRINEEWFVLENTARPRSTPPGLQVISGRKGKRGSVLGRHRPGFMLQPGEKILMVSGVPGKKSHGEPAHAAKGCASTTCFSASPCCRATGRSCAWR